MEQAAHQEAIEKYNIPIQTIAMKQEEVDKTPYILIRHGLSEYNFKSLETREKYGEQSQEFKEVHDDPNNVDPELHPVGFLQCEAAHPVINQINFKVVFCSPMQRAMMTTIHMFKSHPLKDQIKFKVLPIVHEILSSTNDIAIDCNELMAKYADGQPGNFGIKFDWSKFYDYGIPQLWQIYTLSNVKMQQVVFEKLQIINPEDEVQQKTNVNEVLKQIIPTYKRFEDCPDLLKRADVIKKFMRRYLDSNPMQGDEKIAIVCHSFIMATMTAEGLDENDKHGFKGYIWPQNCQLLPFSKF